MRYGEPYHILNYPYIVPISMNLMYNSLMSINIPLQTIIQNSKPENMTAEEARGRRNDD
jgi:hypothetical protein